MQEAGYGPVDLVIGINQKFLEDIVRLVKASHFRVPVAIDHYNVFLVVSMPQRAKSNRRYTKMNRQSTRKSHYAITSKQGKWPKRSTILAIYFMEKSSLALVRKYESPRREVCIFDRWKRSNGGFYLPAHCLNLQNKSDRAHGAYIYYRSYLIMW